MFRRRFLVVPLIMAAAGVATAFTSGQADPGVQQVDQELRFG